MSRIDFNSKVDLVTYTAKMKEIDSTLLDNSAKIEELSEIVDPFTSSLTLSPDVAEKGSTVSSVRVSWNYNKEIKRQILNNEELDILLRSKTLIENITTDKQFTLISTSVSNKVITKSSTLKFVNNIIYGCSSSTTYNSDLLNSLTSVLSDTKGRSITVNCSTNQYIYYAIPSRLGSVTFNVGGFEGGFTKVNTISHQNRSGYSENYDIYRSDNHSLGNTTVTIK